jgi:hypothetical protein
MFKQCLAAAAMMVMVGCASQSEPTASQAQASQSLTAPQPPGPAELAAYAGSHQYPTGSPARNDLRAAALVNAEQGTLKVYNFGTEPIRDADLWVNQAFVRHIGQVAPGSSVTVQFANLYNGLGQQFSGRGDHVNLVQIEQDHNLQTLMGPVAQ